MKILRVLNTNSVVTIDEKKREVIITGPGIGFKKKKGECIDERYIAWKIMTRITHYRKLLRRYRNDILKL